MTIRAPLAAVAAVAMFASTATAAPPMGVLTEPVFACSKKEHAAEIAKLVPVDILKAGQLAKKHGCEPMPAGDIVHIASFDWDTRTTCIAVFGDTKCRWIPAGKTRTPR